MISPQPSGKVVELVAIGQDRRKAHDPPLVRVRAAKQPLDLHLVADLALVEADHVAFVENEQADVVEKRGLLRSAKSSFSGVATTMSRSRIASSSKPLTPMLP